MVAEGHWRAVRVDDMWVAGIAIAAGVGVVLAGPSPTGSTLVDVLLIIAAVAVCISTIATAPWTEGWRGDRRARSLPPRCWEWACRCWPGSATGGTSDAVQCWPYTPVLLLTLLAVQRRSGNRRLRLWSVVGGFVAIGLLALLGFGVAAAAARPNLSRGTDEAKQALRSLETGDFEAAQQGFHLAAGLVGRCR